MKKANLPDFEAPVPSVSGLVQERRILLDLGSDLTRIRNKGDLLILISKRLKGLFYFTHAIITIIDHKKENYAAFVYDIESSPLRTHPGYLKLFQNRYTVNEPFIRTALAANGPVSFLLEEIKDQPQAPPYLRVNYEGGIREMLMTKLQHGEQPLGFVHMYSDRQGSFTNEFRSIMSGIAPQLSIAVTNIIKNEDIQAKEQEQSFLLDFSVDIAHVKTKAELQTAISKVLDKLLHTKLAMIRVFDDDGYHLPAYMFDRSLFDPTRINFDEMAANRITIEEPYTAKVLASVDGLVFNIDEELKSGNDYAKLWKSTGLRNVYGLPLRVSDKNIGTIWLVADRLSRLVLRGICAQISIAISNIQANEKLLAYKKRLEEENDYLREQISTIYNFSELVGNGEKMQQVYRLMSLVADSNATVLTLGETGTGKELIARAIHNASPRKDHLMVKVNCAALPANLIESELFGHERGAFTGAIDRRIGKFELANNSSLFLDEIGELPFEAQSKLLRVIQERELERLGGKQTIKVDVRLIVATNRNLEEEVKAGRFRADLYYRLNVFPITLPPLRDRPEDIEPLMHYFIEKYSRNTGRKIRKIKPTVIQQLKSYTWPGNVRELEHLIERTVLLTTDGNLNEVYIPKNGNTEKQEPAYLSNRTLDEVERSYIIEVLKRCGGKISGPGGAAEILDVPGNTLHSKLKKLGITKADYF